MRKHIWTECQTTSFLHYISDEARFRKTANAFGISRVTYDLKGIKRHCWISGKRLHETPRNCSQSGQPNTKIFRTPVIPTMYRSNRWYTHSDTPIRQPNKNYADYINRTGFTSINDQALCDYRCFLDIVVK